MPFPVHFRNVGALDAWRAALCATPEAKVIRDAWAGPECTAIQIRKEILAYYEHYRDYTRNAPLAAMFDAWTIYGSSACSANLMFELHNGTMIDATPALETLHAHSDIDLSLPMTMIAPPFAAHYLRFGQEAIKLLPQPTAKLPAASFDGVYIFASPPAASSMHVGKGMWIEFVFVMRENDFEGCSALAAGLMTIADV